MKVKVTVNGGIGGGGGLSKATADTLYHPLRGDLGDSSVTDAPDLVVESLFFGQRTEGVDNSNNPVSIPDLEVTTIDGVRRLHTPLPFYSDQNVAGGGLVSNEGGGGGSVTSVGITVGTGLTVSGSPITSSGIIAIQIDPSYKLPTSSEWAGKQNTLSSSNTLNPAYINTDSTHRWWTDALATTLSSNLGLKLEGVKVNGAAQTVTNHTVDIDVPVAGTDYLTPSAIADAYLPLTGGTLAKNSQSILALQNTAANYVVLQMKGSTGQELASWEWNTDWGLSLTASNASGTSLGKLGINTDGTPYFANTTDWVQNTLLHASNYKGTVRLGLRCENNIDGSSDLNNMFDTSVGNYNGNFKYFAYVGHNGSSPNMTAGVHGFPTDNDANALLTIDTFKDPTSLYLYQVGFSSNGSIYYRKGTSTLSNDTWSDPFGGYGLWNRLVSEDYNGDATITRDLTVSRHIAVPQDGTIWLDTTKNLTTSAFLKRGNASDNDYSLYIHAGKDQNSNDARLFLEAGSVHVRKGCNMYFSAFDSTEADPWIGLNGATTGNSRNDFYIANPGYNVYMYAGLYVVQGGNLIPYANGTQSLGGSSNFWGTLYANKWYPDATDTGSYIEYDLANHAFKINGKMYATDQIAAGGLISNS